MSNPFPLNKWQSISAGIGVFENIEGSLAVQKWSM